MKPRTQKLIKFNDDCVSLDLTEIEKQVCNVDGEVYQGGETFNPKSNPKLECYCMPGYTGIVYYKKITLLIFARWMLFIRIRKKK